MARGFQTLKYSARLLFGLYLNLLSSVLVKRLRLQTESIRLPGSRATTSPDRRGRASSSVSTNKQTAARFHLAGCCVLAHPKKKKIALLAEEAASLGMHCDDNEGNRGCWVMDTESAARWPRVCWGADGPPRCSARCPSSLICHPSPQSHRRRTFGVFVLPSPGVMGFLRQSLAICWIVFHTAWCVVRLFCYSELARFQGIRSPFWKAAIRICPHFGSSIWIFYMCVCVCADCKSWESLKSIEFNSIKKWSKK